MGVPNTLGTQCVNRLPAFFLWSGIPTVFFKTFTRFPRFFQPVFKWRKGPRYIRISSSYSASGAIILQWRMGITQKKWTTSKKPPTRRKLRRLQYPPKFCLQWHVIFWKHATKMMWRMDMGYGFICRNWRAFWCSWFQTKAPKRSLWWYNVDGIFERNSEQPRFRGCIRQPIYTRFEQRCKHKKHIDLNIL